MRKSTVIILCLSILTLTTTQLATADYQITNASPTETASVAYAISDPAGGG